LLLGPCSPTTAQRSGSAVQEAWQVQPFVHQRGPLTQTVHRIHPGLAVVHLAELPDVLAAYPNRLRAALENTALVKDQCRLRRTARQPVRFPRHLIQHRPFVPSRDRQEVLIALFIALRHHLRYSLHVPLAGLHQPAQILIGLGSDFARLQPEVPGVSLRECKQTLTD